MKRPKSEPEPDYDLVSQARIWKMCRKALRGPPKKKRAASAKRQPKAKKEVTKADPKALPPAWQSFPQGGMNGMPMTNEEIRAMALSLYGEARNDPQARKFIEELHLISSVDVAVECSYYTGAWHALMKIRAQMKNRSGPGLN
jgi:hypothetical protein